MALFGNTKKITETTNKSYTVNQASAEGGNPPIAVTGEAHATINVTDQGALSTAEQIALGGFGLANDGIQFAKDISESFASSANAATQSAVKLAADRSQSEGSQQSESLIKLAMMGTAAISAVFIARSVFS